MIYTDITMSNTADVLLETGTAYKSRVHAPLFFVESMLLIYLVICVVFLLFSVFVLSYIGKDHLKHKCISYILGKA
jgi:hypothetical protein